MAISLVSGGALSGSAANGGDVTITLPTLLENDFVYVIADRNVISTSGYTNIGSASYLGTHYCHVNRKKMGSTPDSNVVVTGSGNTNDAHAVVVFCLRGVDTATPEDATSTTANGNSTNPNAASITTVTNNAWVIACASSNVNDASITGPSGYSNHTTINRTDTNPATTAGATFLKASFGAENPPGWTSWSSAKWAAVTVAVRPAIAKPRSWTPGFIG